METNKICENTCFESEKPKTSSEAAMERVQTELRELNEKIVKLTAFLYSEKSISSGLSGEMLSLMRCQLDSMKSYAENLQRRLAIWGLSDEELARRYENKIY